LLAANALTWSIGFPMSAPPFFVGIASMVVGEVSLNAAIAFAQTHPIKNQVSAPFPNFR
jgi:hypothetical protein